MAAIEVERDSVTGCWSYVGRTGIRHHYDAVKGAWKFQDPGREQRPWRWSKSLLNTGAPIPSPEGTPPPPMPIDPAVEETEGPEEQKSVPQTQDMFQKLETLQNEVRAVGETLKKQSDCKGLEEVVARFNSEVTKLSEQAARLFLQLEQEGKGDSPFAEKLQNAYREMEKLGSEVAALRREVAERNKAENERLQRMEQKVDTNTTEIKEVGKVAKSNIEINQRIEAALAKDRPAAAPLPQGPQVRPVAAQEEPRQEDVRRGPVRAERSATVSSLTWRERHPGLTKLGKGGAMGLAGAIILLLLVRVGPPLWTWAWSWSEQVAQTPVSPPTPAPIPVPNQPSATAGIDLAKIEAATANGALQGIKPGIEELKNLLDRNRREDKQDHSQIIQDLNKLTRMVEVQREKTPEAPQTVERPSAQEESPPQRLPLAQLRQVLGW